MQYDAIIIGSGQGGNPLAHKLADLDWRVALIERRHLGGTCINYGCTPTKAMLASAKLAHDARRAPEFGVHTGEVTVDLAAVVARKDKIVREWREGQQQHIDDRPTLDLHRGHGRFTAANTITVESDDGRSTTLTSDQIIIDTGSRTRLPNLPGLDEINYLTNRSLIELTAVPQHLVILGGGYLGLEFGQMFRRFGSAVTIVEEGDQIAAKEDADVAQTLQAILEGEGIQFRLGAAAREVHSAEQGDGFLLVIERAGGGMETIHGSRLLVAVGRTPNTDDLGLDAADIKTTKHGYIQTNDYLETTAPGVWAIGDVTGGPAFTHISYDDHFVIYDALVHGRRTSIADRILPYALFTDPELGRVGLSQSQARRLGYRLKVGCIPVSQVARAVERGETEGLMKVVINADDEQILGAAVLSPAAGELVQTIKALMMARAPWTLFKNAIFIHPTMTEGFFSLFDSIEQVDENQ